MFVDNNLHQTIALIIRIYYTCLNVKLFNNIVMDIDFGYGAGNNNNNVSQQDGSNGESQVTNLDSGGLDNNPTGAEDVENLDEQGTSQTNESKVDNKYIEDENNNGQSNNEPLASGTTIDADGKTYTVDDNGNVLDENGNIFKEANQVQDWINSFDNVDDSDNSISISALQEAIGVDITDDNDQPVSFDNTVEGITSYVNAVLETARQENYDTAINTLYERYPILQDVLNYYIANGNSMDGYGQFVDRSGIEVDDTNEVQQEAIIRTAWSEQGRKGDVESYIQYLKSSGTLLPTAREELRGLQEADAQYKENLAKQAQQEEEENIARLTEYWNGVKEVIDSRKIAGYQIPDSIIINRNGQQFAVTPNDFYNYLYRVNEHGQSMYALDLAQETPEERRDDEILRAYLKFTGGNYSNLVNMAINQEKVKSLKLRAKERNASSIRINKPKVNNSNKDIDFGW